jgi:ubiquinol-cytochrome c reductase cytochrome b subunit
VAILTIFGVLTLAGGNDVLAYYFGTDVETLTFLFRVLVVVLPIVTGVIAYRLAIAMRDRPTRAHPSGGIALRRTASGGFEEIE